MRCPPAQGNNNTDALIPIVQTLVSGKVVFHDNVTVNNELTATIVGFANNTNMRFGELGAILT